MTRFTKNPDYTLRWPANILADELERLIEYAENFGTDHDWDNEVRTLLRQAFSTAVPCDEFERARHRPPDPREEPF